MSFDYSASGLAANEKWKNAAEVCHAWLSQNMTMFGPERINNFMHNQPVTAAKRILANCDDVSDESIAVLLLGPAKGELIESAAQEKVARLAFGDRVVDLIRALDGHPAADAVMERDVVRIGMAEGLSAMGDQLIGRKRIDAHHQVRWNMLRGFEEMFEEVKGREPKLEAVFADSLRQSRAALEALDKAPKPNSGPMIHPRKPPGR